MTATVFSVLAALFVVLAVLCTLRGLHKLRRARELESEPQFRRVAHQVRIVGWFLLTSAAAFLWAVLYTWWTVYGP